jgi:Prokaryotic E2 family A/ThiF family/Prokaryotic homologs of the JAB domain
MPDLEFSLENLGKHLPNKMESLKIPKARAAFKAIQYNHSFKLISIYSGQKDGEKFECFKLTVNSDVPQVPKADIRPTESLLIFFRESDSWFPEVLANRKDFPIVPHLNRTTDGNPKSLCLYSETFSDKQLTWTGEDFLNRIQIWLKGTSRNNLHQDNQPLEPFFHHDSWEIIIPDELTKIQDKKDKYLIGTLIEREKEKSLLLDLYSKEEVDELKKKNIKPFRVLHLKCNPQVHGLIANTPPSIIQLDKLLEPTNINLIRDLREFIKSIYNENPSQNQNDDFVLILIEIPLKRSQEKKIEHIDFWGFIPDQQLKSLGLKIDALHNLEGQIVPFENLGEPKEFNEDVPIQILKPILDINRQKSQVYNELSNKNIDQKFLMVGVGALGSHLLNNFARMGFGKWTITDKDHLLPHNLCRHILTNRHIGHYKAECVSSFLSEIYPNERFIFPFHQDILKAEENEEFLQSLKNAKAIIDSSASLPVLRKIAADLPCKRAISIFLTPSGKDGVLLAEDDKRKISLDSLEAQYFRWITETKLGKNHLTKPNNMRFAGGCGDISSRISYEDIVLFSTVLSRRIRETLNDKNGLIEIWGFNSDFSLNYVNPPIYSTRKMSASNWKVIFDDYILGKVTKLRKDNLPNETGGPLIGYFDTFRKRIYVVDAYPAPSDSKSSPTGFIRGTRGLKKRFEDITKRTLNRVDFIGDWHSHPRGVSVRPSNDDKKLLNSHALEMGKAGLPGLILIVGDNKKLNWVIKEV